MLRKHVGETNVQADGRVDKNDNIFYNHRIIIYIIFIHIRSYKFD